MGQEFSATKENGEAVCDGLIHSIQQIQMCIECLANNGRDDSICIQSDGSQCNSECRDCLE